MYTYYGLVTLCMEQTSTDTAQEAILLLVSSWLRNEEVPLRTVPALPLWAYPVEVTWAQIIVSPGNRELHVSHVLISRVCLLTLHTHLEQSIEIRRSCVCLEVPREKEVSGLTYFLVSLTCLAGQQTPQVRRLISGSTPSESYA